MTKAKGSFDFFKRLFVVGTAFMVDRIYFGGQLDSGLGVQELFGGKTIGGGGRSSSETLKG